MADNTVRGRFVWHELTTPNKAAAHDFYSKAVGWAKQAWDQDPSYTMFAAASGPLGASIESREDAPHWRPYIGTLDVDESVATATRLGAKVLTPATSLPNAGRFAVLEDPHGGKFGVHSSPTEPRPETPAVYGEFYWHELATTTDPTAAFAFYKELFGWDEPSSGVGANTIRDAFHLKHQVIIVIVRRVPISTLFPYATLFRSRSGSP